MPISDTEEVSDCTIPGTRINVIFHNGHGVVLSKFVEVIFEVGVLKSSSFRNKLNESIATTAGKCLIWS